MNVNLGSVFDQFVSDLLKTGLYQSQSEILREGLRLLKEKEDLRQMRLSAEDSRGQFINGEGAFKERRKKRKHAKR